MLAVVPRIFHLTIEGDPVAKGRGRIVRLGAHMGIKTPDKTRRYEDIVRQRAAAEWGGQPLIANTPVVLSARFYRSIPASWSKRSKQMAASGELRPLSKPDCSNYLKAIEDGMNGVVFFDDALIVSLTVEKWYSERPRVEVAVTW